MKRNTPHHKLGAAKHDHATTPSRQDDPVIDTVTLRRTEILSALRSGPVLRNMPAAYQPFTLTMAVNHLRNGGSWSHLAAAGLARSVYLVLAIVITLGILSAGGIWWALNPAITPAPTYSGVGLCVALPTPFQNGAYASIVLETLPGTPAQRAGLAPGDRILAIDSVSVAETPAPKYRGEPGTTVTLTVLRAGHDDPEHIILTRASIAENLYREAVERHPVAFPQ